MSLSELQKYTSVSKYARWVEELGRREVWPETVDRYTQMLADKYPGREALVRDTCRAIADYEVMPSMRGLQFGGRPIVQHNARLYNCLKADTRFITSAGVKSFLDFNHGDRITVLTHAGNWKPAVVKCYGRSELFKTTFRRRGGADVEVWATANHRWLVNGGREVTTEELDGDVMVPPPSSFDFEYDDAPPDERLMWAYGYVYGDGTRIKDKSGAYRYSMVRLCGQDKARFRGRFEELGFATSEPKSIASDAIAYTGHYLKEPVDPATDERRLVVAFVRGYLDADGGKNSAPGSRTPFDTIQATGEEQCDFIRRVFPTAGVYVLSETDYTGQVTNFGVRPYTKRFRLSSGFSPNTAYKHIGTDWDNPVAEDVWCLEVEGDRSFVLPGGLVTGNCTGSYCDRLRFFAEGFYLLLCGSGVGFSVQERHTSSLPGFSRRRLSGETLPRKTFVIPDTIEGWADCSNVLLSSWFDEPVKGFEEFHDCEVHFDPSLVRRKGTPLSFGIGVAPGPMPLLRAIKRVHELLARAVAAGLTRLDGIHAYDLFMHWADAVISGGVRRSATICIFDASDRAMRMAKTGDWHDTNPQRGRSNNSALLLRDQTAFDEFWDLFEGTRQFGEPGFYWADHPDVIPNPCVEISFYCKNVINKSDPDLPRLLGAYQGPVEDFGGTVALSGFQMCNLTTINGRTVRSADDFHERCERAALLGVWQKGFDHFPYLGEVTDRIVRKEALLGVSVSGMMHHPRVLLDPAVLRRGAEIVLATDGAESVRLGLEPCARGTCVKPDGNSASALGSFSGCHAGKFRRGFRCVQANRMEGPYRLFRSKNPQACEPSVWSANGTDDVIRFCVEYEGKLEEEMTAVEFLEVVRLIQENWVRPATRAGLCSVPGMHHNVSNTVRVRLDEWEAVARHIYAHREAYAGVSLIGYSGDRDYPQAPFTTVYLPAEQEALYGVAAVAGAPDLLRKLDGCGFRDLWDASNMVLGLWPSDREPTPAQQGWAFALGVFAAAHLGGDLRRATYCLKDAFNHDLWVRLKASFTPVDYSEMAEEQGRVDLAGEVACGAGGCEL